MLWFSLPLKSVNLNIVNVIKPLGNAHWKPMKDINCFPSKTYYPKQ